MANSTPEGVTPPDRNIEPVDSDHLTAHYYDTLKLEARPTSSQAASTRETGFRSGLERPMKP